MAGDKENEPKTDGNDDVDLMVGWGEWPSPFSLEMPAEDFIYTCYFACSFY